MGGLRPTHDDVAAMDGATGTNTEILASLREARMTAVEGWLVERRSAEWAIGVCEA
jgi:hypothetical protein